MLLQIETNYTDGITSGASAFLSPSGEKMFSKMPEIRNLFEEEKHVQMRYN